MSAITGSGYGRNLSAIFPNPVDDPVDAPIDDPVDARILEPDSDLLTTNNINTPIAGGVNTEDTADGLAINNAGSDLLTPLDFDFFDLFFDENLSGNKEPILSLDDPFPDDIAQTSLDDPFPDDIAPTSLDDPFFPDDDSAQTSRNAPFSDDIEASFDESIKSLVTKKGHPDELAQTASTAAIDDAEGVPSSLCNQGKKRPRPED